MLVFNISVPDEVNGSSQVEGPCFALLLAPWQANLLREDAPLGSAPFIPIFANRRLRKPQQLRSLLLRLPLSLALKHRSSIGGA